MLLSAICKRWEFRYHSLSLQDLFINVSNGGQREKEREVVGKREVKKGIVTSLELIGVSCVFAGSVLFHAGMILDTDDNYKYYSCFLEHNGV